MIAHESERTRDGFYGSGIDSPFLLFALYPFIDQEVAETRHVVFFVVILVAGAYAVSHNRRFLVAAIVLAAGMLGTRMAGVYTAHESRHHRHQPWCSGVCSFC